tara:strand:- start:1776 stop:2054 length:279 start_codon:yes stop_codon:yes gene_type:complete
MPKQQPFLIRYSVGHGASQEMPFLLNDIYEAKDVAHTTLRFAVRMNEEENGAADIFDGHGEKLGRMAVLFDHSGAMDHEHWTWFDGEKPHLQ